MRPSFTLPLRSGVHAIVPGLTEAAARIARAPQIVRQELARQRAVKSLCALDNRTLEDIGVARAQIMKTCRRGRV